MEANTKEVNGEVANKLVRLADRGSAVLHVWSRGRRTATSAGKLRQVVGVIYSSTWCVSLQIVQVLSAVFLFHLSCSAFLISLHI